MESIINCTINDLMGVMTKDEQEKVEMLANIIVKGMVNEGENQSEGLMIEVLEGLIPDVSEPELKRKIEVAFAQEMINNLILVAGQFTTTECIEKIIMGSFNRRIETKSTQEQVRKMSEGMRKKWREDAEYREKMRIINSERMKGQWNDSVISENMINGIRESHKKEEYRKKMSIIMSEITKKPEFKQKLSKTMKKKYSVPAYKKLFREIAEENKEVHSKRMTNKWQDPQFVFNVMSSRKGHERALEIVEEKFGAEVRKKVEAKYTKQ